RVFNVDMNGTHVLLDFDVYSSAGGANRAVDQGSTITVTNGALDIRLNPVVSDATINAIEIVRMGGPLFLEDTSQRTTFYYDGNPFDGTFTQYSVNRLAAVEYSVSMREMYSYTPGGLVTKKRLTWTDAGRSASLDTSQAYDNEGKVTAIKYPD